MHGQISSGLLVSCRPITCWSSRGYWKRSLSLKWKPQKALQKSDVN